MQSNRGLLEADILEGTPHPRFSSKLIGHEKAFQTFIKSQHGGRLHHAWILSGKKGIGKATLAWKIVTELSNEANATQDCDNSKVLLEKKIKALSLSNLFLCRRPYDDKVQRLKKFITIDEIRKLKSFFQMSAIENEWRIAIIDCADDLNNAAANALLKLLEEPPNKSILIIISNQPGRLPATVRSRCRSLHLKKLNESEIKEVLTLSDLDIDSKTADDRLVLSVIADGSAGMAITALNNNGIAFFNECLKIFSEFPNFNRKQIQTLSENVKNNIEKFKFLSGILLLIISRLALLTASSRNLTPTKEESALVIKLRPIANVPDKLAELYSDLSKSFLSCEELNLDTANQIFNSFIKIERKLVGN
jgi:DNA polymerase-3 subunit delta'